MSEGVVSVVDHVSHFEFGDVPTEGFLKKLNEGAPTAKEWNGVLAIFTDEVKWTTLGDFDGSHVEKLLELRAYNENEELHGVRDTIGADAKFAWRIVSDERQGVAESCYDAHFDDTQYLDIDEKRSSSGSYVTTGGGDYRLPSEDARDARKVVVRNYIIFDNDGMARIVDFRIVKLEAGGKDDA